MKKLILFLILTEIAVFSGCVKEKSGFGSSEKITGQLIMLDTLSNGTIEVPNALVFVGFDYKPNSENYSYKVQADKYGHFEIPFLIKTGNYQIYAMKSFLRNGSQYVLSLDTNIGNPRENLIMLLKPDLNMGRLSGAVMMHDSSTTGSITVKSADVFIGYKFIPNSTHYTCKLITDENGSFTSPIIPFSDTLNYTFFATKKINIGGRTITLTRANTFTEFKSNGSKIVILPSDSIGFVTIKIIDKSGNTPQPYVTWCLFSDPRPFYNPKPCEGSFYSSSTNINGLGYISGLAENGKYYIKVYKPFGSDTLWVKDSLTITNLPYPVFTYKFN
ncbi:MAG: hypothetical protein D4R97_07900 [Bacteroidetes bacterium]|nr:MAG: hypothetical protein D4R97_07900 [Bacteroidota bacterium]